MTFFVLIMFTLLKRSQTNLFKAIRSEWSRLDHWQGRSKQIRGCHRVQVIFFTCSRDERYNVTDWSINRGRHFFCKNNWLMFWRNLKFSWAQPWFIHSIIVPYKNFNHAKGEDNRTKRRPHRPSSVSKRIRHKFGRVNKPTKIVKGGVYPTELWWSLKWRK